MFRRICSMPVMRLTKIVCTMGPACNTEEGIRGLAERGMNIARLNFSHGDHASQTLVINAVKKVNADDNRLVGMLLDTKGAEIRTGDRPEPLPVKKGDLVVFSHKRTEDEHPVIGVNYPEFWKDAKDARFVLIDSGELVMDIVSIDEDRVVAKSAGSYAIGSRRHINLPGSDVTLPSLAEKDWLDIELACQHKLDYIALSFIRKGSEVDEVRAFTTKHGHPDIRLISKIENGVGVDNIDEIIAASDGIMIARGDLGAEIPLETLPFVQDDIAERCLAAGKPVIMATQMLESMIENPMPTRAEVTDIAHAVLIGVDSTMLSGETAAGKHPFEALEMMVRVQLATEPRVKRDMNASPVLKEAAASKAQAIVIRSNDGSAAHALSMLRPAVPLIIVCDSADVARKLQLNFGVYPLVGSGDMLDVVRAAGLLPAGSKVVVVDGTDISVSSL
jgi:pyruvate kinase